MCIYSLTYPPGVGCKKPSLSAKCAAIYLCMCGICETHTFSPPIARALTYILIRKCARVSYDIFAHFLRIYTCIYNSKKHINR